MGFASFNEIKYADLPYVNRGNMPWAGIRRLRQHLQEVGRLMEAMNVMRKELLFVPLTEQKVELLRSFLVTCDVSPRAKQPLWWLKGICYELLAKEVHKVHGPAQATEQVNLAQEIFQSVLKQDVDDFWSYTCLHFDVARAYYMSEDDITKHDRWVSLADDAASACDYSLEEAALSKAYETAEVIAKRDRQAPWPERYFALHSRLRARQEELGSIFWLLFSFAVNVPSFANHMHIGYGNVLDCIQDFKATYPNFAFTKILLSLAYEEKIAATRLKSRELEQKVNQDILRLFKEEENFWKAYATPEAWVHPQDPSGEAAAPKSEQGRTVEDGAPYRPLSNVNSDSTGISKIFADEIGCDMFNYPAGTELPLISWIWRILLQWMKTDYASGTLSDKLLRTILQIPRHTETAEDSVFLDFCMRYCGSVQCSVQEQGQR
jgi:hypothetical protein